MLIKKRKPSRILIILGEYFGFSVLSGLVSTLFFSWASRVIAYNSKFLDHYEITLTTEYWMNLLCILGGSMIAFFSLIVLLQRKFSYIIEISNRVEEMEAGNLSVQISIEGDDELSDLAFSINRFAKTMDQQLKYSAQVKQEQIQTVATLSHDLRTPLTSVVSYLQLIRDGKYQDEEQIFLYIDKAYEKAQRIREMTDRLFESCMTNDEKSRQLEKVEGNSFVKQILFEVEDFLQDTGYKVELFPLSNGQDFCLMIDREKVSRIFDNVLSNIEKYADAEYPVQIEAKLKEQYLILRQTNRIIEEQKRRGVESHLLGLKSVETAIREIGGELSIRKEEHMFILEMSIPIC